VELVDCEWDQEAECWAWVLARPKRFSRPVPFVGNVGLFDVPDNKVADQV
jgi:hypothetical protein